MPEKLNFKISNRSQSKISILFVKIFLQKDLNFNKSTHNSICIEIIQNFSNYSLETIIKMNQSYHDLHVCVQVGKSGERALWWCSSVCQWVEKSLIRYTTCSKKSVSVGATRTRTFQTQRSFSSIIIFVFLPYST